MIALLRRQTIINTLTTSTRQTARMTSTTNTFTIPFNQDKPDNQQQQQQQQTVTVTCENNSQSSSGGDGGSITRDQLLAFPAFKTWLSTLQKSLAKQKASPTHEFHKSPYILRGIHIQAVDYFGGGKKLGFVKMKADVSNDLGESLPGSIFLRGGSVAMLLILQPDDVPSTSEEDKHAIMTVQPRIPAGSLNFAEIPAGMLDDSGTFAGGAAKEIHEETGLLIPQEELVDLTALALTADQSSGKNYDYDHYLQKAVYPSPGGSDEFIPVFLCQKRMPRRDIQALQGRLTGNRDEREKITLKIVSLNDLWKEGLRDGKTLAAWALYTGLKQEGKI